MPETILTASLIFSFLGMVFIVARKLSVLSKIPAAENSKAQLVDKLKDHVRAFSGADNLDYEVYLQKVLSKVRVLTLRTEQKTGAWLEKLRQKSRQKKRDRKDDYWKMLKKAKDGE